MRGDDCVRYCGQCNLNVFNLSAMTADEAASLIERTQGRLCVRLYKRTDGTVITQDCPVGIRRLARNIRGAWLRTASFVGLAIAALFVGAPRARADDEKPLMGKVACPLPAKTKKPHPVMVQGGLAVSRPVVVMGDVAAPADPSKPTPLVKGEKAQKKTEPSTKS